MTAFELDGFNRSIEIEPENEPPGKFNRPIEFTAPGQPDDPTRETYLGWGDAGDFFNEHLFDGELPPFLITYQRSHQFYGYYAADRFVRADLKASAASIDEIAINPAYLDERPVKVTLSTLVHEMAHLKRCRLFQHHPAPGYHDKKWAKIMIDVGLMPVSIDAPGKTTGYRVTHNIIPDGRFDVAAEELLRRGFVIRYVERERSSAAPLRGVEAGSDDDDSDDTGSNDKGLALRRARSAASKTTFTCVNCKPAQRAWAKPGAHLICGDCNTPMLLLPGSKTFTL